MNIVNIWIAFILSNTLDARWVGGSENEKLIWKKVAQPRALLILFATPKAEQRIALILSNTLDARWVGGFIIKQN